MIFVFYILAAVLVWFSYKSFCGGIAYLNYFKRELAKPRSSYTPFATIIAPYKGLDDGLEENIRALLEQDYPNFELIFVVDDESDPALLLVKRFMNDEDAEARKLVIAPKATESSQKVENLREAILHVYPRSEVFVFVDSDARPNKDWLRSLVGPLADENVGATTGYRWFLADEPTLASDLCGIWNASIASSLGPNTKSNFCWGGSMAIRREVFDRLQIRKNWRGTLSDDFTLTRIIRTAGLNIHFVPQALTRSIGSCTFPELWEFTTRQMKITRVYAQHLWLMSLFGSALFCSVMVIAFAIVLLSPQNTPAVWISLLVLILVSIFSIAKSTLRLRAVLLVLGQHTSGLRRQFFAQNVLWLIAPVLFLLNCIVVLFSRTISWRGTLYEMVSTKKTNIITK